MVKSEREHVATLREACITRASGRCEWPTCDAYGDHMAHLVSRGMGGSIAADTLSNVAWLCRYHHDILDGRQHTGLRREVVALFSEYLAR